MDLETDTVASDVYILELEVDMKEVQGEFTTNQLATHQEAAYPVIMAKVNGVWEKYGSNDIGYLSCE